MTDTAKLRLTIARALTSIETLALDLHAQALNDPNARDFPGGTALHMLAPAASRQQWLNRYAEVEMQSFIDDEPLTGWNDPIVYQFEEDANEHPLYVLATWTQVWREQFDQPTQLKATISREVDYLRKSLDRICALDEFGEPAHMEAFDMADELRALVRRMEDVTHEGDRPALSRVTCTNVACAVKPRLVRPLGKDDHKCPECKMTYTPAQYALAKANNLRSRGADRFVLVNDAIDASGVPKQTMYSWMRRMDIKAACDLRTKRVQVWWPDVRERMLLWATRKRVS